MAAAALAVGVAVPSAAPAAFAATWTRTSDYSRWTGVTALERGQGIATDGASFYYSGTWSLAKTTIDGDRQLTSSAAAIPGALSGTYKSDHIGDIDYHDGLVVAPLEDGGNDYKNPLIALYSADDLSYTGRYVRLPLAPLPGGVPWVAVDASAGLVYTAAWDQDAAQGTDRLVAFSLDALLTAPAGTELPVVKTVKLSRPLSRIQGAAMSGGLLWASVDITGDKSVYSIDPASGAVSWQFHQDVEPDDEVEGIAAVDLGPAGGRLHVLNVGSGWKKIFLYLQHYSSTG